MLTTSICVHIFIRTYVLNSLEQILRSGMAGSHGNSVHLFEELLGCLPEQLHHSHQPWMRVCISPHPHHHLHLLILAGLVGVQWDLVVLVCISLRTTEKWVFLWLGHWNGESSLQTLWPFLKLDCLYCWVVPVLYLFRIQVSYDLQVFSPDMWAVFPLSWW